ncbi:MAG: sporulation membrane protein YtaF [Firmicutes bacterium]|nr:sporulation membrane protein YtaF [Bacillota bacterium]
MNLMILLLGIVVSLDGFAAALAYGARRVRLTPLAVALVSLASAVMMGVAMLLGQLLGHLIPPIATRYLGGVILLLLGCYLLYQQGGKAVGNRVAPSPAVTNSQPLVQLNLRPFGLIIQILRDPMAADQDQSGTITWQEAGLLGLALALDSFGAGIGAAMTGLAAGRTAVVAGVAMLLSLLLGWELGYRLRQHRLGSHLANLPGILLICLGLVNLYTSISR